MTTLEESLRENKEWCKEFQSQTNVMQVVGKRLQHGLVILLVQHAVIDVV
jgi:hypothetical protein